MNSRSSRSRQPSATESSQASTSRFRTGVRERALPTIPSTFTASTFYPSTPSPQLDAVHQTEFLQPRGFDIPPRNYPPEFTRTQSESEVPAYSAQASPSSSKLGHDTRASGERTADGSYMVLQQAEVSGTSPQTCNTLIFATNSPIHKIL